jgi:TP901 family phage tail tape measure protein
MAANFEVGIGGSIDGLEASINKATSKLEAFGKRAEQVGKELSLKLTAPLVLIGTIGVKTFADFDDQMRKVGAIAGAASEDLVRLTEKAKEMGSSTRFSATQAGQGLEFMALAGFNAEQSITALPAVLSLAAAAAMDLGSSADIVTDTMSAFNIQASEAGKVSDVFARLQSKANTNVLQAGEAFKQAAPNARAFGQSLETTSALLGKLADAGIKGGRAGTSLNAIMRDLRTNAVNGNIAINGQNVAIANADGSFRNLIDIINDMRVATSGLTDINKANALSSIFMEEAIKGANVLMTTSTESLKELENQLQNSEGAAQTMAEQMEGGLGGAMRSMRSAMEGALIVIGEQLAPMITQVAGFITRMSAAFSNASPMVQKMTVIFGGVAAALGPILLVVGKVIAILPKLISAFKTVRVAVMAISGPVGILIGALTIGIPLIIANWDKIKQTFTDTGITDSLTRMKDAAMELYNTIVPVIKDMVKAFMNSLQPLIAYLKDWAKVFYEAFVIRLKAGIDIITNIFGAITDLVKGNFSTAFERLKIILFSIGKTIISSFMPIANLFGQSGLLDKAISFFDKKIADSQAILDGREMFDKLHREAMQAKTGVDQVTDAVEELATVIPTVPALSLGGGTRLAAPQAVQSTQAGSMFAQTNPSDFRKELDNYYKLQEEKKRLSSIKAPVIDIAALTPMTNALQAFSDNINDTIQNGIIGGLSMMADGIGRALAEGTSVISAFGNAFLGAMGGFLSQLGSQFIAFGVAGAAFSKLKDAIATGVGGLPAALGLIGAGIALKGIGSAIQASASGGLGGSGGGFSGGTGNNFNAVTNRQEPIELFLKLDVDGEKLYAVQSAYLSRKNRIVGGR